FLGSCNLFEGSIKGMDDSVITVETAIGDLRADVATASRPLRRGEKITLAIRPEKIAFSPPDNATNQWKARVGDLIYGGAETQYKLRIGEHGIDACGLNCRVGNQGFQVGQTVSVHLPAEALVILEN